MFDNFRDKRRAKRFRKIIGKDLPIENATRQFYWASVVARSAWNSAATSCPVLAIPVLFPDEYLMDITEGNWIPFQQPTSNCRFGMDDKVEGFRMYFDSTDPKDLLQDPDVLNVLGKAYDLLEVVEENVYELPVSITSAGHKLRTAITKHVQNEMSKATKGDD